MPPVRTERIPKERYRIFLSKAEDFRRAMDDALSSARFNAAVSNASHCVISAGDALLAYHAGIRSKARNHREVVSLLLTLPLPECQERGRQLVTVLNLKTTAEYEDRNLTHGEATRTAAQADRFLEWAKDNLPSVREVG
jgi:hypothetical protein